MVPRSTSRLQTLLAVRINVPQCSWTTSCRSGAPVHFLKTDRQSEDFSVLTKRMNKNLAAGTGSTCNMPDHQRRM